MDPGRKGRARRLYDPGSGHGPSRPDRDDGSVLRSEAGRLAVHLDLPDARTRPDVHRAKDRGRIVLESKTRDGYPEKWIFSEITKNSFRWHAEETHDNGKTWILTEEMRVRRKSAPGRA